MSEAPGLTTKEALALQEAFQNSRKAMDPFRREREEFLRQYCGRRYPSLPAKFRVLVNDLEMALTTFRLILVAHNPRAMVDATARELQPVARQLAHVADYEMERVGFSDVLDAVTLEALLCQGVVKMGLHATRAAELDGEKVDIPELFVRSVSFSDWVQDMEATTWEESQFCGNRYSVLREELERSRLYNREAVRKFLAGTDGKKAKPGSAASEPFMKKVFLWDLWLPYQQAVVTFGDDADGTSWAQPLRVVDWKGPEGGPFHRLLFHSIPDQSLPLSPVANLFDLHILENNLYRKLARQAERQKSLGFYRSGKEGKKVRDAEDGELIATESDPAVKEMDFGGPNSVNFAFLLKAFERFDRQAGNLGLLAGLGPQSETVGQDQILAASASKRVTDMKNKFTGFVRTVVRNLLWYAWHDPLLNVPYTYEQPEYGVRIPMRFQPEDRRGDFLDYNIRIDPYSMTYRSPAEMMQMMDRILDRMGPFLQILEARGVRLNFQELLRFYAETGSLPALGRIFEYGEPMEGLTLPHGPTGKPPVTERKYTRENRSVATPGSKDAALISSLMGVERQPAEARTAFGA